jgi:hypothetical protein
VQPARASPQSHADSGARGSLHALRKSVIAVRTQHTFPQTHRARLMARCRNRGSHHGFQDPTRSCTLPRAPAVLFDGSIPVEPHGPTVNLEEKNRRPEYPASGWPDAGLTAGVRGRTEIENTNAWGIMGRLCSRSQWALNRAKRGRPARVLSLSAPLDTPLPSVLL